MAIRTDLRLQTKLQAVVTATTDPAVATANARLQDGLLAARELAIEAMTALAEASAQVDVDRGENAAAVQAATEAHRWVVEEYALLRRHAQHVLLPLRQTDREALGPAELSRRASFLQSTLGEPATELRYRGRQATHTRVRETAAAIAASGYASHFDLAPLESRLQDLAHRLESLRLEELDDAPLMTTLRQARQKARRAYRGLRSVLFGALILSDSPIPVRDFVLRQLSDNKPELVDDASEVLETQSDEEVNVTVDPVGADTRS